MELKYDLTKEDYLGFQIHVAKQSETVKRALIMQRLMGTVLFLLFTLVVSWVTEEWLLGLFITFAVASVLWVILYPKYFYGHIKRNVNKMLDESRNDNMFGLHTLVIDREGFTEKNRAGEKKTNWAGIERVDEDEAYFFLFTIIMEAYIVPKRAFENKDRQKEFKTLVEGVNLV
ncbi:YcxB family protein [Domibacillus sp. DTU_2020_1001157_1_SI_ALB_TIR_016]|uniref:YcxB family protein n=1 Tax=Domibacillus sp. DTU_2020_1001157_1_SI_ALB_TIR_016 TaxID=3077789 RepID=UPI0028E9EBA8|nr:YcxB family protein [Domibacillus sp. DTU_2020_1001157_1_SI_ALB_TIR_016]WNS77989.1 YcxB family protein [Domibacillus sp. DTU_2020_1001157_1_SI_ALB_TIR_016]